MSQEFSIVGNLLLKVDGAEAGLNKLKNSLSKLEMPKGLENSFKKSFSNLDGLFEKYKAQLKDGFNTKGDVSSFAKTGKQIEAEYDKISAAVTKLTGKEVSLKVDLSAIQKAEKELEKLIVQRDKLTKDIKGGLGLTKMFEAMQASDVGRRGTKVFDASNVLQTSLGRGDLEKARTDVETLISELNRMSEARKQALEARTETSFSNIIDALRNSIINADNSLDELNGDIKTTSDSMASMRADQMEKVGKAIEDAVGDADHLTSGFKQINGGAQEAAESMYSMTHQLEQLKTSTQYFFSLRNMINLLKRGIDEAVQSVKELDKAMTDTAVVTDYKVSDLWGMLPEYTKVANQLGATTQGAYETMTLYYQQGLDQQQAFELGAETMKMARIAGLDYAETTDMMTAALRGFNMELNEVSAKRVNDVYSELAAITASDTEELGTAMQRTASIAHSAGMSFEGTTAFLAQAIETTREPAENIGTAMKTIVARFQEMKKNPLEITEIDGEEVSYNKVDAALQSIGVSLKDTNGQFRELDQVFLDISSRWDSLTQTQQRYIATIAAGSRQQSRFIAMMDDYDRTVQLMEAANNSAGASDEQFGKTMDSLESKLNKLHNAWQEFTMGIANNGMIKLAVDGLTGALNIVNQLIDTFSFGLGPVKSFISVFAAFTGLKAAGRFANAAIGGLGGLIDPQSSMSQGFKQGALGAKQATNAAQAQMIYQPIVAELRAIRQLKGQEISQENQSRIGAYEQYNKLKESRAFLGGLTKGGKAYSLQDIQQSLAGLDANSQNVLMRGNSGTAYSMTNAILSQYYKQLGGDRKAISSIKNAERYLNSQRQAGQLTWEEYFKHISNPELMRAALDKSRAGADVADTMLKGIADEAIKADSKQYLAKEQGRLYGEYAKNGKDITSSNVQKEIAEKAAEAATIKATEAYKDKSGEASAKNNKLTSALDAVGRFGSGISQVGMGIQSFGNILTSSANPALQMFGSVLTSVGGLVSGLGMGISAISTGFTALAGSEAMEAAASWLVTAAKGPEAASSAAVTAAASALTGGLLILVAVVAGVALAIKKHNENIKKAAEEVTQNYKDRSSENQSNLANLKQWRSELAVLSKGVDENGLNVSLDTSDYDHYLEIVDEIAKINPSIVQGYNAQGHAIIDNNKALEETLALEQQHEKDILNEYTSDESLSKLLKARNLEGRHQAGGGFGTKYVETIPFELKPRTNMRQEISAIGDELRRNKDYIDLSPLNIDIDALASGSEAEFNKVISQYDEFKGLVLNSINAAGDEWSDASKEAIEKSFSTYSEQSSELDKLVQPVYEALSAKASQTAGFKQMENSLKAPFQNALKELATTGDFKNNGKAIGEAAKNMATKFASYNDIYLDAMDEVAEANEQFAADLNEQTYKANTKDAIQSLEDLKKTLEDTPEGNAISQWIDNEIAKIENHISGGAKTIEEAWDTIASKVSTAEGALEEFNKATERDFSTAADGMQQIYETAMGDDTFHSIGLGDNTFWEAAETLLGADNIMDKSTDEVRGMMQDIEPFLKEGPEGVQNFAAKVADLNNELENVQGVAMTSDGWFESIDENVNPDAWKEIADILGISEDLLTSMINKARQFRPMDFSDMQSVREAYAASDTTIHGTKQVEIARTDQNGKTETIQADKLFITDAELRDRMGSDYYQKEERDKKVKALSDQGIGVLPEHLKDLDTAIMKNEMGISNMTNAIETFGQTGVFDKSEIYDAALNLAKEQSGKNFDQDAFDQQFNDEWSSYLENMDYPTLQPIQSIEGYVASIADSLSNKEIAEGRLTERKSDELEAAIYGKRGEVDSLANYFKLGKDASGQDFNEYTYNKSLNELTDLQTSGQQYLNSLQEGLGKATGEEQARYYDEINKTKQYLSALNEAIESGKQKWEEFNNQNTPEIPETSETSETPKETVNKSKTEDTTPDPYSNAEKELYTRNSGILSELASAIKEGLKTNEPIEDPKRNQANATETNQKMWDWFIGKNAETSDTNASLEKVTSGLTEFGSTLTQASTALSSSAKELSNAASVLAQTQNTNNTDNPIPKGTTIPGAGFVESDTQINGNINVETSEADAKVTALQTKLKNLNDLVNQGGTYNLEVSGINDIKAASNAAKTLGKNSGTKTIGIKTGKADTSSVDKAKQLVDNTEAKIKVGANVDSATAAIRRVQSMVNGLSTTAYVDVEVHVRKTGINSITVDGKTITVNTAASGRHNHGYASAPSFGSAARGKYGQIGPKGKGGLTLTGELGYEIAWLPDENRSMVLGANGPQMINLPGNAVVWNHEQSKKIVKQKAIPAGSHSGETTVKTTGGWDYSNSTTTIKKGTKEPQRKKKEDKHKKDTDKQQKKNADNAAKVIKKAGNINAWWWNMGKKVEATQRIIDKTYKQIEKLIKKAGTTLNDLSEDGNLYIKKLNQQISLNTKMRNKADDKLTILDNGPSKASKEAKAIKKAQDRVDKAEKKVKKAKTAKEKAAAKDELKKAKKNLKKKQKTANYSTISYDVTTVKKDKKGKKTKSKKTKKQKVDLSKFIKYDEATEAYIIDYKKINSKNWDKSKKKAVMEAAQKKIEDYQKKRDTAEDNIDKAQEALEKFGTELYENFNAWENELTQIYFITKKIEETEKRIAGAKTSQTLQQNRLMSGLATLSENFKKLSYQYFQVETHGSVRNINDRNNQIDLQKQNVLDIVKGTDLIEQRSDLLRQLVSAKDDTDRARINAGVAQLTDELKVISQAQKYIRPILNGDGTIELNFDADTFAHDRNGTGLSATTAEKIQEYIKKIQEANGELLDLYETQVSDLNELYETLVSLQEQYLDYSNQLLEAIEKEAADRVEKIKTLSNIVSDSFKELIDSVKSQLDQRRQQEDNSKTERDIVRKQNRLALLRANSAGGNVVAAAQLEQEIADAQQSYGRTLEDQLLDKLQQTEDRAAKQREQQIKILEAQLELNKINGVNTGRVADLMDHPERYQTEITRLIKYSEDYNRQTREGQANINTKIQGILQNLDTQTGIPARILDVKTEIQTAEKSLEETLKNFLNTALKQTVDVDTSGGAGAELAKVLGDLKEQQDKLQKQLENLNSQRDTLKAQLDTAVKDTEKKYNLLQTAKSQLSSAESQLNEARKSGNQQKISAAQQRYNNAKTNYNNANQAWTTARNKEQQLRGRIVTIDNQIKQVTTQLNDVKTQYEQTNQEYSEITGEVIPVNTDFTSEDKANQEANAKQIAEKEYSDYLLARKKAKSLSTAQINSLFAKGKAAQRTKKMVISDILNKDSFTGLDVFSWKSIIKELANADGISRWNLVKTWPNSEYLAEALLLLSDKNYPNKIDKIKKHEKYKSATDLNHYKQGGLADYTGPAWLDGTPSKPELVLNSTDTKNLIALKDVLSKVMKGSLTTTTENQGDILYEININVDKIEKDYDVDQVVDKVKKEIVKSAGYRNVTQVRNFR